jgi:hypothetical protein
VPNPSAVPAPIAPHGVRPKHGWACARTCGQTCEKLHDRSEGSWSVCEHIAHTHYVLFMRTVTRRLTGRFPLPGSTRFPPQGTPALVPSSFFDWSARRRDDDSAKRSLVCAFAPCQPRWRRIVSACACFARLHITAELAQYVGPYLREVRGDNENPLKYLMGAVQYFHDDSK